MARKPNYDFEKRKKEIDRKAKKDAKREEKRQRRDEQAAGESAESTSPTPGDGPAARPE